MSPILQTIREELSSFKTIGIIFFISLFYVLFSASLLNYRLALGTFFGDFPILYKLRVFLILLFGTWTGMSRFDFFLLLVNALLVGLNLFLIMRTLYVLQHAKKAVKLSIGGATIISLVTAGCTSCGLSLLSILGLSASLSFLPFHGMEIHLGAIFLLLISALYMLKQLWNSKYCKVPKQ